MERSGTWLDAHEIKVRSGIPWEQLHGLLNNMPSKVHHGKPLFFYETTTTTTTTQTVQKGTGKGGKGGNAGKGGDNQ